MKFPAVSLEVSRFLLGIDVALHVAATASPTACNNTQLILRHFHLLRCRATLSSLPAHQHTVVRLLLLLTYILPSELLCAAFMPY